MSARIWYPALAAIALTCAAPNAQAQSAIFGPQTFHGLADLRVGAADGEKSWLDGGFGKTSRSGGDDGVSLAEAALEWKPRFNFALSGVVSAEYQPKTDPKLDLGEAYLKLRAPPQAWGRISARAGLFYPPVSMENDGVAWTNPDMLSSSAINSWIGEEVKVAGVELTYARPVGDGEVSATGAVFGWNDTAGTLLAFRGWALGGLKIGADTSVPLPPLSAFATPRQGEEDYPVRELDHRAGAYGRVEWRMPSGVSLNAFYYDNGGNLTAVDKDVQWAWRTRFLNLGLQYEPDEKTKFLAQAMTGNTRFGFPYQGTGPIWFDVDFHAAYLLVRRRMGADTVSGRLDGFGVDDRTLKAIDNNAEHGWAATAAWRHPLTSHADLVVEALHVDSNRPSRAYGAEAPRQSQNVVQSALRLSF